MSMVWLLMPMALLLGFAALALVAGHPVIAAFAFVAAVVVVPSMKVEKS